MNEFPLLMAGGAVVVVLVLTSFIITTFLKSVDAGEILLASRGRHLRIYRGPCKAMIVPVITQVRRIPAQAINVDIEITDQTADRDGAGRPTPVKVTVRASAIVSVGEDEAMVNTAANKFFSKSGNEQMSIRSGEEGGPWGGTQRGGVPRGKGFGFTSGGHSQGNLASHVEGHAAAIMHQRGLTSATLYVESDPCQICSRDLMNALPPGSTLTVVSPGHGTTVFRSAH